MHIMTRHETLNSLSYGSGFLGVVSGITFGQWLSLLGALVMVGTFMVNFYYRRHEKKLAEAEHLRQQEKHSIEMNLLRQSMTHDNSQERLQ